MKSNNLLLIENYQNFVKSLDEPTDCDMLDLDQEVSSAFCDTKPEMDQQLPVEQPLSYNMPNFLSLKSNTSSDNTYLSSNSLSCSSIPTLLQKDEGMSTTMSSSLPSSAFWSTSSASPLSSSQSQSLSSPAFQQLPVTNITSPPSFPASYTSPPASSSASDYSYMSSVSTANSSSPSYTSSLSSLSSLPSSNGSNNVYTDNKTRTFVTEFGGSGCTVLQTGPSEYIIPTVYAELTPCRNQTTDSVDYTSIVDPLSELSFYDELISGDQKGTPSEINALEDLDLNSMICMMENDRKKLNIGSDPYTWSITEVSRWVKWVCEKENLPDISYYLCSTDGARLCAWDPETFKAQYGPSGHSVQLELDLWKTSSQLSSIKPSHDILPGAPNGFQDPLQFIPTPSSSPAHSIDSSQDSRTIFNSSPEHSEDDVFYTEQDKKIDIEKLKSITSNSKHPFKPTTGRGHKKAMTLWQFILGLLIGPDNNSDCIRWLNKETRIFKIEDSKKVATMWGKVKSRPAMNYDKLSRSIRQYYKKGIIKKPEQTKRLVYQFCPGIC